MTDKVQKIREEVARIQLYTQSEVLKQVLDYIDKVQEEPVSEDLEEASKEWLRPQLDKSYADYGEVKMMELTHFDGYAMLDAIEFGAKWGRNQAMAEIQAQSMALAHGCPKQPVSEDLPHIRHRDTLDEFAYQCAYDISNDWAIENPTWHDVEDACKLGAKWQEANLWKPADGDDLPEIDREVVVLTQPYSDDNEHLRVAFAHRPNKYAKVWNSDLGEEQVIEIERYGKGEWNIPFVKYWLDVKLPKEIEL